jgi:hypothetical protein
VIPRELSPVASGRVNGPVGTLLFCVYAIVYTAATAATTTLRVRPSTRDRINRLAAEDHVAAPELIERLVAKEEHERLLRAMNDDFGTLRDDATRWAEFQAETAAWDTTSGDIGSSQPSK